MTEDLLDRLVAAVRGHYEKTDTPLLLSQFGLSFRELSAELKKQYGKLKTAIMAAGEERLRIVQSEGSEAVVLGYGATESKKEGQAPSADQDETNCKQVAEAASTWLLTFSPKIWDPDDLQKFHDNVISMKPFEDDWSCSKQAKVGDEAYLMRLGGEPRGIIAYGIIVGRPFQKRHWQKDKAEAGETYWCAPVRFLEVRDPDRGEAIVQLDVLKQRMPGKNWTAQNLRGRLKAQESEVLRELWHSLPEVKIKNAAGRNIPTGVKMASPNRPPRNLILYGPPGTGKTHRLRSFYLQEYDDLLTNPANPKHRYEFVTFHQSYAHEDFVEGIRPMIGPTSALAYAVQPGVFRRLCKRAKDDPDRRYAIFIDEINRGNVAKVFGELITLLELDKRATYGPDGTLLSGLELTLPYSGELFGVPANLDVYGTMNTADRSIALLDLALRRRFEFEELVPNSANVPGADGKGFIPDGDEGLINLRQLLDTLNGRITHLLHRDQTIGHAYLMKVKDFVTLKRVVSSEIIPLLQEYFYEDLRRICLVLGYPPDLASKDKLIRTDETAGKLFSFAEDSLGQTAHYMVMPEAEITAAAVRSIYEGVTNES